MPAVETILIITVVCDVAFLGFVLGRLAKIETEIGNVHQCEQKAYFKGWADCIEAYKELEDRGQTQELIRCKKCKFWNTKDGRFKDIDGRQWHNCPHIGIDTDEYFYCREAKRKEE